MDWSLIWKAVVMIVAGTFLLRIAGRKSISQLTIAQTIIMISIGTLLIQPVVGKNVWFTILIGAIMVGTLLLMEYMELKSDTFEKLITGKSLILIENGQLNAKNMSKIRMTVDQLEMQLRQNNVSKISDVKWATLEPNGQLGFMLKDEARPVTKKELQQLSQQLDQTLSTILAHHSTLNKHKDQLSPNMTQNQGDQQEGIFQEVSDGGHQEPPPKYLQ